MSGKLLKGFLFLVFYATTFSNWGYAIFTVLKSPEILPNYVLTHLNIANKTDTVLIIGFLSTILLQFFIFNVMLLRLSGYKSLQQYDSKMLQFTTGVISNQVESMVLILPSIWIFSTLSWVTVNHLVLLGGLYIGGRILWWFGYLIGTLINFPFLRAVGFASQLSLIVVLTYLNIAYYAFK